MITFISTSSEAMFPRARGWSLMQIPPSDCIRQTSTRYRYKEIRSIEILIAVVISLERISLYLYLVEGCRIQAEGGICIRDQPRALGNIASDEVEIKVIILYQHRGKLYSFEIQPAPWVEPCE